MPPYVGKKALKQQKLRSELLCLRHPIWTPVFFQSNLEFIHQWLFQEQPLLNRFSLKQLEEMDEMILPSEEPELLREFGKMMFQQELNYLELTDPEFDKFSDDPALVAKYALATVMTTRKKNQMMLTRYLHDFSWEIDDCSLMYPLCLYGQLIQFMTEQNLFLSDDNIRNKDMRLLVRPLLWFIHLFNHRMSFVDILNHFFQPIVDESRFPQHASQYKHNIVELERRLCIKAWDLMHEEFPMYVHIKHFVNYYDLVKNGVLGCIFSDSPFRNNMRVKFMNCLFVEENYDWMIENRYECLNSDMWNPVINRVNKVVETIKIEPNSDYYFCPKCKNNRCHVESVQTRSLDEAATIFVTCVTCGNCFKAKN